MKIYRLEISNIKEFQNLTAISKILNFFDVGLVSTNTSAFMIKDLEHFLNYEDR